MSACLVYYGRKRYDFAVVAWVDNCDDKFLAVEIVKSHTPDFECVNNVLIEPKPKPVICHSKQWSIPVYCANESKPESASVSKPKELYDERQVEI